MRCKSDFKIIALSGCALFYIIQFAQEFVALFAIGHHAVAKTIPIEAVLSRLKKYQQSFG
jgi:hypothetical protein